MRNEKIDRAVAYIEAYNRFDIDGMMAQLHHNVTFRNYENGKLNLEIRGSDEFREQAEVVAKLFRERNQSIREIRVQSNAIVIEVAYAGTLSIDLPNGPKAGEKVKFLGTSEFEFHDERIISIIDRS